MLLLVMIGDREIIVSAAAVAAFSIPEKYLKRQRSFRYNALQGPLLALEVIYSRIADERLGN